MSFESVEMSAQYCGCDEGAKHLCERHRAQAEAAPGVTWTVKSTDVVTATLPSVRDVMNRHLYGTTTMGIGGAPTRPTTLPTVASERKKYPIASGVLDYFPDAIVALANLSWQGNEQHNPGMPLHWDRAKSSDEADTALRHFMQRGTLDTDGKRHMTKAAWRFLALLQKEIESELRYPESMYGPDPRD